MISLIKRTSHIALQQKSFAPRRFFADKDPFSKNNLSFNPGPAQSKTDSSRPKPIADPHSHPPSQHLRGQPHEHLDFQPGNFENRVPKRPGQRDEPSGKQAIEVKKSSLMATIKEGLLHVAHGLNLVYRDFQRLMLYRVTKVNEDQYTIKEYMDKERIKEDLVKFVPYGLMIVLPFGELFLPPYLALFPNAIPSEFFNEETVGKIVERNEERQREAFDALFPKIRSFFQTEFDEIDRLKKAIKDDPFIKSLAQQVDRIDQGISAELIANWPKYKKKLKFANLSVNEMDYVMKFMFINYVNGVHIVNTFINLPRSLYNGVSRFVFRSKSRVRIARYSFDFMPLNALRRRFLEFQLKRAFRVLENQDKRAQVNPHTLVQLSSTEIYTFARQRGIRVDHDQDRIKYYENVWVPQSRKAEKLELKFWVMLIRFHYGKHLV